MRAISFRQQGLVKEADKNEAKRASGLNWDHVKDLLSSGGLETSDAEIKAALADPSKVLFSPEKIEDILSLKMAVPGSSSALEKIVIIIGAAATSSSRSEAKAKIELFDWYLVNSHASAGSFGFDNKINFDEIIKTFESAYSIVQNKKKESDQASLDAEHDEYLSDKEAKKFDDGWRVVYIPASDEMKAFPGLPGTSHDRILEGNKNGLCLGSDLRLYQTNKEGEIYSVRDPGNNPQVTIRILNNVLEEAKGKYNGAPTIEAARHATSWFESINDLKYFQCLDYRKFPPLNAYKAIDAFRSNPDIPYYNGWISSWYGKGAAEIDEDVLFRIKHNDPLLFTMARTNPKLIEPVVKWWCLDFIDNKESDFIDFCTTYKLHKIYKDLPEMIQLIKASPYKCPSFFLSYYTKEPWAIKYIDMAAEAEVVSDPSEFIMAFNKEPWAQKYLPAALENALNTEPSKILSMSETEDIPEHVRDAAAKKLAEIDPYTFILLHGEEQYARRMREDLDYRTYNQFAANNLAERDPYKFLSFPILVGSSFAEEYYPIAADNAIKIDPYKFLKTYSFKNWAKDYIDDVANNLLSKDPCKFAKEFGPVPGLPGGFPFAVVKRFGNTINSKSYLDIAREKCTEIKGDPNKVQKKSTYSIRLLKLSKALNNLGLKEESDIVVKLISEPSNG